MKLLAPSELEPLLCCPACRCALLCEAGAYRCGDGGCALHGTPFPNIGATSALVDFRNSILDRDQLCIAAGASPLPRRPPSGLRRLLLPLVNPLNRVAERNAARLGEMLSGGSGRPLVLVVGGGSIGNGLAGFCGDERFDFIAFDIYASANVQFIADAHAIPLRDRCVDAVIVQAVLEHVLEPWTVVAEIHRVLRDDGLVYAETPFMQQVHEGPYDFTRFTSSGHRWLFKRFTVIDSGLAGGLGSAAWWTTTYLATGLLRSRRLGNVVGLLCCWLRLLDAVIPERYGIDGASGSFFLGRKAEQAMAPLAMVAFYQGAQRRRG
jgi:SAM-dependent methyltransferase